MKSHESLSQCRLWRRRRSDCPLKRCWGSWLEQNDPLICLLVFWKKEIGRRVHALLKQQFHRNSPEFCLLTQESMGSTCVWACPSLQWPTGYVVDKGQMSWHPCRWWKPSGRMVPGAVAPSSVGPSWPYLCSRPLWSHSTAAQRLLEAAHSLWKKRERAVIHYEAESINQNMLFWSKGKSLSE